MLLGQSARALSNDRMYVDFSDLADQIRDVQKQTRDAYSLICAAQRVDRLETEPGVDQATLRRVIDIRRGQLVDSELATAHHTPSATSSKWTIEYRDHGGFLATNPQGDGEGPTLFWGMAPTPRSAAHTIRDYFLDYPPTIAFDPPLPDDPRPLTPIGPNSDLSMEGPTVTDLLEQRGPVYDAHIAACAHARNKLAKRDLARHLADQAARLNATDPQLHPSEGLETIGEPANADHAGYADTVQWVRTSLVIATGNRPWGEFGGHRPDVPHDIARGLCKASDLDAFTDELFGADEINLVRIAAWAGPIYKVGVNGNHRVHAARMLDLPWLATSVSYQALPPCWDLLGILSGDPEQEEYPGLDERRDTRLALITGLLRRRVIDGELTGQDKMWPTVCCRRLPAPWLLRDATYATAANAAYETRYPGALAQLGIPEEVSTDPAAWTTWLTQ